ncbi:BQ2448_5096 [Microbotryum intermedium]|uniref:BQ2448_5096 protein n=1 Tax=Microbotryum intermedium TaxID=269621 RepID=A0A238F3A2_9BASI|nr:BQ2448_5096 [Microbotryum intermedium]
MSITRNQVSQDDDLSFSMNASLIEVRHGGAETPSETGSMSSSSSSTSTTLASNAPSVRASTAELVDEHGAASYKDPMLLSISSIGSSSSAAISSSAPSRSPLSESMLQFGDDVAASTSTSPTGDRNHAVGTSVIIDSSQASIGVDSTDQDVTPSSSMTMHDNDPFNTTLLPTATANQSSASAIPNSAPSTQLDYVPDSMRTPYPLAQELLYRHHRRQESAAMSDGDDTMSIASTNGSLNSELDHLGGAHMLVMPSMRLSGPHSATTYGSSESIISTYRSNEHDDAGRVTSHALSSHDRHQATKLLILGKSVEHRVTLARLLGMAPIPTMYNTASHTPQRTDSQLDSMASSFWSIRTSEHGGAHTRSSTRQSHPLACDLDTLEPLPHRSHFCEFSHPSSDDNMRELVDSVARSITTSLEGMEALINPTRARSEDLVELVMRIGTNHFEASLMLFSSPPNAAEIALARILSQIIPVFPILVLPPAPASIRPQKTTALVEAVVAQLDWAGVRWTAALDHQIGGSVRARATTKRGPSPLYLLPHELFTEKAFQDLNAPTSATDGTAPPSPTFTASSSNGSAPDGSSSGSRSSSPATTTGDLARLRTLVGTAGMRDRIRRANALAFLDWREIEIAAVGETKAASPASDEGACDGANLNHEALNNDTDSLPTRQDVKARRDSLDFSRRVAERRLLLKTVGKGALTATRPSPSWVDLGVTTELLGALRRSTHEEATRRDPMTDSVSSLGSSNEGPSKAPASSSILEPDTPKCVSRSLPDSISPTGRSHSNTLELGTASSQRDPTFVAPTSPARAMSAAGASRTNAFVSDQLPSPFDPFHLPSLLHLVGLNLRLSLMPWPMQASQLPSEDVEKHSSSARHSHGYPSSASVGVRSWMSTAVIVGAVFLAGFFCGMGVSTPLANARLLSLGAGPISGPSAIRGACRSF